MPSKKAMDFAKEWIGDYANECTAESLAKKLDAFAAEQVKRAVEDEREACACVVADTCYPCDLRDVAKDIRARGAR